MSRSERLGILALFCGLYLAMRFLTGIGHELENIGITMEKRIAQLEDRVADLEVELVTRGEHIP